HSQGRQALEAKRLGAAGPRHGPWRRPRSVRRGAREPLVRRDALPRASEPPRSESFEDPQSLSGSCVPRLPLASGRLTRHRSCRRRYRRPANMRLYDFLPSGNGYKVRLALRFLGIPFEYHEVDIVKGESRTPEFLAKNPFGQIPVVELDDGTCLRESTAILMFFADGTPLLPDDRRVRARVFEWIGF